MVSLAILVLVLLAVAVGSASFALRLQTRLRSVPVHSGPVGREVGWDPPVDLEAERRRYGYSESPFAGSPLVSSSSTNPASTNRL